LLLVRYDNDTERKRLEYVLEKYKSRIRTSKPHGAVYIISSDRETLASFLEELYARFPREKVQLYRLEEPDLDVREKRARFTVRSSLTPEEAHGALKMLALRLRATLVSDTGAGKVYVARPRGAYARLSFRVRPARDGGSIIDVTVEGLGSGFEKFLSHLREELSLLGVVEGGV